MPEPRAPAVETSAPGEGYLCPPNHLHQSRPLRDRTLAPQHRRTARDPRPSPQPLLGGLRPTPSGKQSNLKEPADRADQPHLPSPSFPNPLSPGVSGHGRPCSPRALKDGHNVQKYDSAKRKCDTHNTSGRDYNTQNAQRAPKLKTVLARSPVGTGLHYPQCAGGAGTFPHWTQLLSSSTPPFCSVGTRAQDP